MTKHNRLTAAVTLMVTALTGLVAARGATALASPEERQAAPPQGQTPPPATGRAGEPGRGAGQGAGPGQAGPQGRGGGRRGGFAQFTRELASPDIILRGKALYEANCVTCHAPDLRGGPAGTNLLRSGTALADQKGELVGAAIAKHSPPITLIAADSVAVAGTSTASTPRWADRAARRAAIRRRRVERPRRRSQAGRNNFATSCAKCHSTTGDLRGIGSRFPDARALQNAWVAGLGGRFGGGGRGGGGGAAIRRPSPWPMGRSWKARSFARTTS